LSEVGSPHKPHILSMPTRRSPPETIVEDDVGGSYNGINTYLLNPLSEVGSAPAKILKAKALSIVEGYNGIL